MDPGAARGSLSSVSLLLHNGLCFLLPCWLVSPSWGDSLFLIVPSCSAPSKPKGMGFFQKRKFQVPAESKGDRIDGSLK